MDRRFFSASVLAAAMGAVGAATIAATPASAAMSNAQQMQMRQATLLRVADAKLVKCYGVNAIGRNDCAAGSHSCAGQATQARDPASFVLLPQGDCQKIAGGSLKAA